jgi:NADH:ubiquinone oxidoreductase subunit F (NADH-binding)
VDVPDIDRDPLDGSPDPGGSAMTELLDRPLHETGPNDVGPRLLAARSADLAAHEATYGPIPSIGSGRLLAELELAGLTGRGGAGFPAWRKLATAVTGRDPVVVANAAEGEPASSKDATLLRVAPHLVLDGLQLLAEAVGAREAHLYVRPGQPETSARAALAERHTRRRDPVEIRLTVASGRFVDGEESAVLSALEGGAALPRDKRAPAAASGLRGRPTLVHNVETLAHMALIARHGSRWFRLAGTPAEPGTFLATVSGDVVAPGVVESGYGVSLADLLTAAGGASAPLQAALIGGYHGAWVRLPHGAHSDLRISRAGLAAAGATPGAGVVVAFRADACALSATAKVVDYLAGQSARQCGPCLNGLPAMAGVLSGLASGRTTQDAHLRVEALASLVERRGACHHPDGTARLVRSALSVFGDDVQAHLAGRCVATGQRLAS